MRLTVFLVNTICRPLVYLLDLADRDVCKWAQDTDEDERTCWLCGSSEVTVTRSGAVIHNSCKGSVR